MYYNTNGLDGDDLRMARAKTLSQDEIILEVFETYDRSYTPGQVMNICAHNFGKNYPITSVRRSIHTLTDAGKLRKTKELRTCIYGKKAHCWKTNG
jgi:hypothetical protein